MQILEEKIFKTIRKYNLIESGDNIVIGVSGGPDSMTLLNVLYQLKTILNINLYVVHINHSIREEADSETIYVEHYCKKHEISFFMKKIDVIEMAKQEKMSTELVGRNVRYAFFEEVAQKVGANKIATAHNANDNAETVLMNLLRGSGTSGLKGIEKIREGKFIRPILECTRKEIEEYCKDMNLQPKYDSTNNENIYTRNKIRNELIPYLENEFNPNIIETLNRLSAIAQKEEQYFRKIVENLFTKLQITGDNLDYNTDKQFENDMLNLKVKEDKLSQSRIVLDIKRFNELDEVIKSRLILYTINRLLGSTQGIEKAHVEDIIKLCGNNIGNKYLMPNKKIKVFVKKGKVFFIAVF